MADRAPSPNTSELHNPIVVMPAKAGIWGENVLALRPETPAFAGVTEDHHG